jgi:membrane-associated protease RseP (regulator of RpoE activity)
MTSELREYFGVDEDLGVLVVRVETESPAEKAELRVGDVVVEVGGTPIRSPRDLVRAVRGAPEGGTLEIALVREGKRKSVRVALADREGWSWRGPMPRELFPPELEPEIFSPDLERTLRLFRERLRELEERLEDLEEQIGPPAPAPDRT